MTGFVLGNFTRASMAFNTGEVTLQDSTISGGPGIYSYRSAVDAVATIGGANYFSEIAYDVSVADIIVVVGSDASVMLQVATVDTSVNPATITTQSFTSTGSVGTSNIVDAAVTTAKLADLNVTSGKLAANAVTSDKLDAKTVQYAAVNISASDFNGMYGAPKLLVAAGGANTMVVLDKVQLLQTYGTAAFAAGGTVAVQYDSTVHGAGVIASTTAANTLFQGTASAGFNFNAGVVTETFATTVNKGLYLSNISAAFTTGDSTLVAHVWYKIIPTV